MSICPRVGGLAEYLDRLRINPFYTGLKREVLKMLNKVPLIGDPVERFLAQVKESIKAGLHGGMLFEELGFRYIGPVDGHNIPPVAQVPGDGQGRAGPGAAARRDRKGARLQAGRRRSGVTSTRRPPSPARNEGVVGVQEELVDGLHRRRQRGDPRRRWTTNPRVTVMTAAMCQGNKLEPVRDAFPDRFFDTGICEVAHRGLRRRAGQGRAAADRRHLQHVPAAQLRPDLPGSGAAEPAGHVRARSRRPDRSRRADASRRVRPRLHAAASRTWSSWPRATQRDTARRCSTSRSRTTARSRSAIPRPRPRRSTGRATPIELGRAEVIDWGHDGMIIACGTLLTQLRQGGRHAARGRARRRRDQRPLRQAARHRDHPAGRRRQPVRGHRRRSGPDRRLRQRRAGSGDRRRGSTLRTSAAWAFPIGSSNTPSAANCWPIWARCRGHCRRLPPNGGRESTSKRPIAAASADASQSPEHKLPRIRGEIFSPVRRTATAQLRRTRDRAVFYDQSHGHQTRHNRPTTPDKHEAAAVGRRRPWRTGCRGRRGSALVAQHADVTQQDLDAGEDLSQVRVRSGHRDRRRRLDAPRRASDGPATASGHRRQSGKTGIPGRSVAPTNS